MSALSAYNAHCTVHLIIYRFYILLIVMTQYMKRQSENGFGRGLEVILGPSSMTQCVSVYIYNCSQSRHFNRLD